MKFLYPEFLYALAAIAIPIVIHLFNFRKFKRVYFSDIQLLKEIKEESKSKSQLKHLLVLICRILAIAALVFAFAQPYYPKDGTKVKAGNKTISIYIDNSFSTDAKNENGYIIQQEKEVAQEIIESASPADKFHIVTNNFEPHLQRTFSKQEAAQIIEDIKPSPAARLISEIVLRQKDILKNEDSENKLAYLLSDFQTSITDFSLVKEDTSVSSQLLQFTSTQTDNCYIDSIWYTTPLRKINGEEKLIARVYNLGSKDVEVRLDLKINNQSQGFNSIIVGANNYADCEINYTIYNPGIQQGEISISNYPNPNIIFDDNFFFSYDVTASLPIAIITNSTPDSTKGASSIFTINPIFKCSYFSSTAIDYTSLKNNNLVVLDQLKSFSSGLISELNKFAKNGGNILLLPHENADINSYNELLLSFSAGRISGKVTNDMKASSINLEHPLYKDIFERVPKNVDLPTTTARYVMNLATKSNFDYLLRMQNGDALFTQHKASNGSLFFSSVSPNPSYGNLGKHALYIATLLRVGEFSQAKNPLYFTIGESNSTSIKNEEVSAENIRIVGEDNFAFIPEVQSINGIVNLLFHDQIQSAGFYSVNQNEKQKMSLAWNFNRAESNTTCFSQVELQDLINQNGLNNSFGISQAIDATGSFNTQSLANDNKLWKWFIIAALVFLALEILIYRLFK